MAGVGLTSCGAVAGTPDPAAHISSRFMLWDSNEKMLDPAFMIILTSNDNNSSYQITINNDVYSGNFSYNEVVNFTYTEGEIMAVLKVEIDGQLLIDESNIMIYSNIDSGVISTGRSKYTVSLSPFEWTKKEWSIFWAVIAASIYSVFVSLRLVKRYKRYRGVIEVK